MTPRPFTLFCFQFKGYRLRAKTGANRTEPKASLCRARGCCAQLPDGVGKAASCTDDIGNIAVIRNRGNAGERTNWIPGCVRQKYCAASVGYPMVVNFCRDTITRSRCDAEDVNTERPCEITRRD